MHVGRGQEFARAGINPAVARVALTTWTMPVSARIERDGAITATRALIEVTAQRGRAAALDGGQYFQMQPIQPGAASVDEALPCGADNIGHLQRWPYHQWLS